MSRPMTKDELIRENRKHRGTCGVSHNNRRLGLAPAFRDGNSGRVEIARFADGRPAPMHLIAGAPDEWVIQRDKDGEVAALKETIVAGFFGNGRFFTREEAAALKP